MSRFLLLILTAVPLAAAAPPPGESAPASTDVAAIAQANNRFALELYAKLAKEPGNIFISPYSISSALAMTHLGARGQTADQMAGTLHFPFGTDKTHAAFGALTRELNAEGLDPKKRPYQLAVANALWGQQGYPFRKEFVTEVEKHYGAGLFEVDYINQTETARQKINAWVEKQTQDKIKELLKPGILNTMTRLVLTNAIYFKGNWDKPFDKKHTRPQPFHLSATQKADVPMMYQKEFFNHYEAPNLHVLEMPYVGKEVSMVLLVPKKIDGLTELEKGLTPENLGGWLKQLRQRRVNVYLPKFQMTLEQMLNEPLKELGMKDAFVPRQADFSGMDGSRMLFISAVVHKAFVDVNEEGTEAAAATAVVIEATSVQIIPEVRADRPFLFLIRDLRNDGILFMGRVSNPTK